MRKLVFYFIGLVSVLVLLIGFRYSTDLYYHHAPTSFFVGDEKRLLDADTSTIILVENAEDQMSTSFVQHLDSMMSHRKSTHPIVVISLLPYAPPPNVQLRNLKVTNDYKLYCQAENIIITYQLAPQFIAENAIYGIDVVHGRVQSAKLLFR
jgi:hypothetical protein